MKVFQSVPQNIQKLFLVSIWMQHTWTLYMAFRDVGWVAERTNIGDAFGLLSYALIFALAEGIFIFLAMAIISLFLPKDWGDDKQIALLTAIIFVLNIWAIVPQAFSLSGSQPPGFLVQMMIFSGRPLWILYGSALGATLLSIALPALLILKYTKVISVISAVVDRLIILSVFYLILDALGLINIIIRNL